MNKVCLIIPAYHPTSGLPAFINVNNKNLFDYVHHNPTIPIHDLRYTDVTANRSQAGVILLFPFDQSLTNDHHYPRESQVIRSTWHNTASVETLLESIQSEHETIANLGPRQYLAVNQAQRTGVFSGSAIIDTLLGWSLLAMVRQGNPSIVKHPNFQLWLTTMPIVMVDYATSQHHDFNTMLNEAVTTYNANLI